MSLSDVPPARWSEHESLRRMVEGAQRKAARCHRDGALPDLDHEKIRRALRRVLSEIERARWRVEVVAPEEPVVEGRVPLPTEEERARESWG